MSPPTEQLIRDYLNRLSVAARGRLSAEERRALVSRAHDFIDRNASPAGPPDALRVAVLLSRLGDPGALVDQEAARLAGTRGAAAAGPARRTGGLADRLVRRSVNWPAAPGSPELRRQLLDPAAGQPANGSAHGSQATSPGAHPRWPAAATARPSRLLAGTNGTHAGNVAVPALAAEDRSSAGPESARPDGGQAADGQPDGERPGGEWPGGERPDGNGPDGGQADAARPEAHGGDRSGAERREEPAEVVTHLGAAPAGPGGGPADAGGGSGSGSASVVLLADQPEELTRSARLAAWAHGLTGRGLARSRRNPLEATALVLLGLGGAVYPPVWLIGACLAVASRVWDYRDKWVGIAGPVLLLLAGTGAGVALGTSYRHLGDYLHEAWIYLNVLSRIAAVAGTSFLLWRLTHERRVPEVPPWNRPRRMD